MAVFDCPGCAKRREAMASFGKRVVDWMKHPTEPPPDLRPPMPAEPTRLTEAQAEALARIRNLVK